MAKASNRSRANPSLVKEQNTITLAVHRGAQLQSKYKQVLQQLKPADTNSGRFSKKIIRPTRVSSSSMLLYVHGKRTDYLGRGVQDGHLDFHTSPEFKFEFNVALRPETIRLIRGRENGGKGVWRWRVYTYRYTVATRMTCIKMGSNESHFNVSLIVRDKVTRQCPQTTIFEEKGEPKRYRTEVLPLTCLPPYR